MCAMHSDSLVVLIRESSMNDMVPDVPLVMHTYKGDETRQHLLSPKDARNVPALPGGFGTV